MDPLTIIALINGATQMATALAPLVQQGADVFGSDDGAKIKAALAELQAANETLHARVQEKLRTPKPG